MYDKEKTYDEKIQPLMAEIIRICKEEQLPLFATFYLREEIEEEGNLFCTTHILMEHTPKEYNQMADLMLGRRSAAAFTITTKKEGQITEITKVFP